MKIVNATSHPVTVGEITIPVSGIVIRAVPSEVQDGEIDGVPCFRTAFGAPVGVPEVIGDDEVFIVSAIAQAAIRAHRPDIAEKFFIPHPAATVVS